MLTQTDLINILNLLQRGRYNGLEEAEVAVVLSQKIKGLLNARNLSSNDQSRSTSGL